MNKKRYIPLVVVGALILSLLAVIPAFGADDVKFIDPMDITLPSADGTVTLEDDTPEDQTYGKQLGDIGLLVEDSSLDKPIRRVLIPQVDTEYVDTPDTVIGITTNPGTALNAHSAEITVTRGFLKVNDYVMVGDQTVRKVKSVGASTAEPSDGATWRVPARANPRASDSVDNDDFIVEDGRVMLTIPLTDLDTEEELTSLTATATTLTAGDVTAGSGRLEPVSGLTFTLSGKNSAKIVDGAVVVGGSIKGMLDAESDGSFGSITVVISHDFDGATTTIAAVDTTLTINVYNSATSQEAQVVTLDRPFAKDVAASAGNVLRIQDGRDRTTSGLRYADLDGTTPPSTAPTGSEVNIARMLGTTWSGNYMYYAMAISHGAGTEVERPYLVARSRIAITGVDADDTTTVKQRLTGGGSGRIRDAEDALVVVTDGADGVTSTEPLGATDEIDLDTITVSGGGDTWVLAWWIEPNEAVVAVSSKAYTKDVILVLQETDENSDMFALRIGTTNPEAENGDKPDTMADLPTIPVNKADVVTLEASGTSGRLTIETTPPTFTGLSPAHNTAGKESRPEVSAQVTDGESGLDVDDIKVLFRVVEGTNIDTYMYQPSDDGDNDPISAGFEVRQSLSGDDDPSDDAIIEWWIMATDKAGNVGYSDRVSITSEGDSDECMLMTAIAAPVGDEQPDLSDLVDDEDDSSLHNNCDPYVVRVDSTLPTFEAAETGRHWNSALQTGARGDKTEYRVTKSNASSILAIFSEHLDASTVSASDFEVNGAQPVDVSAYNVKVRPEMDEGVKSYATYDRANDQVDATAGDELGYVFLRLAADLKADATPKVELVGEVLDLAGNERDTGTISSADDRIAPTLTVTIDEGVRAVTKDKLNLTITADEDVASPDIDFYKMGSVGGKAMVTTTMGSSAATFVSATEYTAVIATSPASITDGLYTIFVQAKDTTGNNVGMTGVNSGDDVNVGSDTKAILFEHDTVDPEMDIDPGMDGAQDEFKTDDMSGYISIGFSSEEREYDNSDYPDTSEGAADDDTIKGDDLDTHHGVTIVSATLNGEDISDALQANSAGNVFLYRAPAGLEVGEHKLEVVAMDDAGNKHASAQEATITITEREPFSLKLNPGWNLVSIPGEPADPDINVVIPADRTDITSVLAYDPTVPGLWLSASRGADGMFSGTLKNIVATRGYWVETNTFTALPVMIPKQSPGQARVLPTIPVAKGWNMVPILDVDGNFKLEDGNDERDDSDKLPIMSTLANMNVAEDMRARGYLDGLEGVRAYTFNTITNRWDLVSEVQIGKGYWVYVSKAGIIVP